MFSLSRLGLGALLAVTVSAAPALADVVYTDNTFNLANYSKSPTFASDPSTSIALSSSGGTLQFVSTTTSSSSLFTTAQGLANNLFSYNPLTQGAITSIDASVMKNLAVDFTGTGFGNTFRPTIFQDGTFFLAAILGPSLNGPGSTGFNLLAQAGLTETSFLSYNFATGTFGTANPDFDGDPLTFGLSQITGVNGEIGHVTAQYKDLSFDVHAIPEPSTLALLGMTLLGFGWFYRRKVS